MKWYTANAGDQGLIIDEETGRNVAVSYDKKDAKLIAAAPDLLDALRCCLADLEAAIGLLGEVPDCVHRSVYEARRAIAEAEEAI